MERDVGKIGEVGPDPVKAAANAPWAHIASISLARLIPRKRHLPALALNPSNESKIWYFTAWY
jgi:hypothetical protein